jgi:hypothetical protein
VDEIKRPHRSENMNHPAIVRYLLQNAVDSTISRSFTV